MRQPLLAQRGSGQRGSGVQVDPPAPKPFVGLLGEVTEGKVALGGCKAAHGAGEGARASVEKDKVLFGASCEGLYV